MNKRTMGEIARAYNRKRDSIMAMIRSQKVSASMSGIEYYPKPWDDLDMSEEADAEVISANLTWDGKRHDYEGLRKRIDAEPRCT